MSYDFYVNFRIEDKSDLDNLTSSNGRYAEVKDVFSRIKLLITAFGVKGKFPDRRGRPDEIDPDVYARVGEKDYPSGLKAFIHSNDSYNNFLTCRLSELSLLGIKQSVNIFSLPKGSWFLEFEITLKHPLISRDDMPFYIIENPVRKDKVFGIPMTSAMAWKGNLRWTMMKVHLEPEVNNPEEFANVRYRHTLLFGTEKGKEEFAKGWTKYLDEISPQAGKIYRDRLEERFKSDEIPFLTGMLHFYPTFWDRIDMEVINPHDRRTKTGKNPIYFEVVPRGAKGIFRLLYVPYYYIHDLEINEILKDLEDVVKGLKEMMLTYGFSAKKSSGYGVIEPNWDRDKSTLTINDIHENIKFANFEELERVIKDYRRKTNDLSS